jgi:hypothetical protein
LFAATLVAQDAGTGVLKRGFYQRTAFLPPHGSIVKFTDRFGKKIKPRE